MNSWTTLMTVCALTLLVSACDKKTDTPQAEANSAEVKPGDGVVDAGKPVDTPAKAADERKPGMFYVDPGAAQPALVTKAVAVMHGLGDNDVKGTVMFEAVDGGGMKVSADITGLPKDSTHAYHFHVFGDCTSDDGKSAGTHFHFDGSSMNPPKDIKVITGNLGELKADGEGKAVASVTIKDASLQGFFSVLGRAVIIHEKGNDHSAPPIGAAGGRLACGVVGVANQ